MVRYLCLMKYMVDFIVMEENNMKIAVLSGKGGTGKTLLSVNMAAVAARTGQVAYIDCDVEEPNGHLFFKPEGLVSEEVTVKIPVVNNELCNGCRKCVEFCKFNALAYIKDRLAIFGETCHSCGGCVLVCPEKALSEKEKAIGKVEKGFSDNVMVVTGILNPGIASGVPIINRLFSYYDESESLENIKEPKDLKTSRTSETTETSKTTVIDCPPGSACVVMESIKDADYCVLVAEPTLFGVHNLNMVYDLVKLFNKPHGVVLNKCMDGENPAEDFCLEKGISIIEKIPFDKELGTMNSNALIVARENQKYKDIFLTILEKVIKEVQNETVINS